LSTAEDNLIEVCQRDQEQYFGSNDSGDGPVNNAKSDSPTRNLTSVEKAGAILKPGIQTKRALPPWKPFDGVPGIWLLVGGSAKPEVYEHSFEISKEVAFEWNISRVLVNGQSMTGTKFRNGQPPSRLSWKLKCVLAESVDVVRQRLEHLDSAENFVQELGRFQNHWPSGGKLIVEVNPTHVLGQTFYSRQLVSQCVNLFIRKKYDDVLYFIKDSGAPFVELKHHIHEGTNLIRFIQLGDLSNFVFILYATHCASSPETDLHVLDLDNLQIMLQKSRLDNFPGPLNQPTFGAHTAHVSVTVNNNS
jgi:hypothetical protein